MEGSTMALENKPGSRKPITLDLEKFYSGFNIDELMYMEFTRITAETEEENEGTGALGSMHEPTKEKGKINDTIDEVDEGASSVGDYEEYTEEFRSYLCSTPTRGRIHRGRFSHEAEISGFNDLDSSSNVRHFALSKDSGMGMNSNSFLSKSRRSSFFGADNYSIPGSIDDNDDDLRSIASSRNSPPPTNRDLIRRKIELDSDVHDPYSNVDDLELSIEEEFPDTAAANSSRFGSLRRRLSLKLIRRNISMGLFGSYQQRNSEMHPPALPPAQQSSQQSTDNRRRNSGPTGPLNVFFKKFRNRHFI